MAHVEVQRIRGTLNASHDAESVHSATVPVHELVSSDRDQMFSLYAIHYDATNRERFERDLSEKDAVVIIRHRCTIIGFSTFLVRRQEIGGEIIHYLFSGDTVLHSSRWGDPVLLRGWFRAAGAAKAGIGEGALFWFPIIGGHRTFRILPNFFRSFVPMPHGPVAGDLAIAAQQRLRRIRDAIAAARYGRYFDPVSGLVDFGPSQGHLKSKWADVEETATRNRFAAFFLKANPFHFRGVELACLAEFDMHNLKRYGATSFAEGLLDAG
jgi:hypothetical protein